MNPKFFSEFDRNLPAVIGETDILSYGQLEKRIFDRIRSLSSSGIGKGSRVAWICRNQLIDIEIVLALLCLEGAPCPLSFRFPGPSIPPLLRQARIGFFIDPDTGSISKISESLQESSDFLLFTSGSTGTPKLVSVPATSLLESAKHVTLRLGMEPGLSRWLLSLPLFHVSGLSILFRCLTTGSAVVFPGKEASSATHVSFVPLQLQRYLTNPSSPSLRCILLGGAPPGPSLLREAKSSGLPVFTTYGMTESASCVTLSEAFDSFEIPHAGTLLPGRLCTLAPDGEILLGGSGLFRGYDTPDGLFFPCTEEGLFPTGDLGAFDSRGRLLLKGRKDNMFISGGENIHPETIEQALLSIPGILFAVVVPKKDEVFGERPVAFIGAKPPFPSEADIKERLSSLIPKFCIPDVLYFSEEIPEPGQKIARSYYKQKIHRNENRN